MPNSTNGVRSRLSKRSEHRKDKDLDSPTLQDLSRHDTTESENAIAVLGYSSGSLQRLAELARYFETFTRDIQVVEDEYEAELEQETKIRRLSETVEILTNSKSGELEKLRHENSKLLAEQAACQEAKKESREITEKLKAQYAKADTDRQEASKKKTQDEKIELNKQLKTKVAEIEKDNKQKAEEFKRSHAKLSEKNVELVKRCSEAEEKLEMKKTRHHRAIRSLEDENQRLTEDLEKIKSDYPAEGKSVEY